MLWAWFCYRVHTWKNKNCWFHTSVSVGLVLFQSTHMQEQKLLFYMRVSVGFRTKMADFIQVLWASFCFKVNAWKNKDCGFALWASFCFKVNTGKNKTCYFKCSKPHSDSKYTHERTKFLLPINSVQPGHWFGQKTAKQKLRMQCSRWEKELCIPVLSAPRGIMTSAYFFVCIKKE